METINWYIKRNIYSVDDLKRKHKGHFFDESTMRFFKSRVLSDVFVGPRGVFFVTSEKGPLGVRLFTVRRFNLRSGSIDTVGEFNSLTRSKALSLSKTYSLKGAPKNENL